MAALCFAGLAPTAARAQATNLQGSRPNIVVIVADDLGWRDVGFHGSEIRTPNLDSLAATGARLENHYVFPVCSPTRTALLTSLNPRRFGILGAIGGGSKLHLPLGTPTLASVLKAQGYETAIVGKWHLGLRPEVGPRKFGFDFSYGYLHGQIDPYTHLYKTGEHTWNKNDSFIEEEGHATDLLTAGAVKWVEAPHEGPFLLYLCFSVPHTPLEEPKKWVDLYQKEIADPSRRVYAAAVSHMDWGIGQVVEALARAGRRDKTLILFTSDNGGQQNMASETDYGGKFAPNLVLGNNLPLRGWKAELYEGGIRVPALANWPGKLEPRVVTSPESALDWLPTLAALTGYKSDPKLGWEGIDIWPLLTGEAAPAPRTFDWQLPREAAVREGDWKLIIQRKGNGKPQLFNLAADPYEKTDLADANPQRVAHLNALLLERQK